MYIKLSIIFDLFLVNYTISRYLFRPRITKDIQIKIIVFEYVEKFTTIICFIFYLAP